MILSKFSIVKRVPCPDVATQTRSYYKPELLTNELNFSAGEL